MAVDVSKVDSVDVAVYVSVGVVRWEPVLQGMSVCFCNKSDGKAFCSLCNVGSARIFFPSAGARGYGLE